MRTMRGALVAVLLALVTVVQAQPRGPAREILPLTGDLYRARNGNWYTIFLVTRDGTLVGMATAESITLYLALLRSAVREGGDRDAG